MPGTPSLMRPLAAAFILGGSAVLAYAPFGLYPLAILSLAGLVALIARQSRPRDAAWLGFAWGLSAFLGGVSWVYVSMHDIGGMPMPLAALATVLFCAYLALFPALACAATKAFASGRPVRDALLFASLWTLAEWLRGSLFTGFPWLAIGYSQSPPSPLAGFAPLFGVFGLSFAVSLCAAQIGWSRRWLQALGATLPAVALAVLGWAVAQITWTAPQGAPLTVSLLQGNVAQSLKWQPDRFAHSLQNYLALAEAHPARLIVLPETALPGFWDTIPPVYRARWQALAIAGDGDVLIGVPMEDQRGRYYNAVIALGGSGLQYYAKRHLVPFGEFVPPGFGWLLRLMRIPMSDFSAGARDQAPLQVAGLRVAMNICYEDLFGDEIVRGMGRGEHQAGLLVNLSNVAWFGRSLAPAQHLQISQLRALETGRPMLRATNTGMTAVVSPEGRVEAALPPFTRGALTATVSGRQGETPYMIWGDWPVLVLSVMWLVVSVLRRETSPGNP